MSSNVGLTTPRGSGTSGYVQRNLSHLKPRDQAKPYPTDDFAKHRQRKPDPEILEHDRKRRIEVEVFELRDRLEDEGKDEDEIDDACDKLREELAAKEARGQGAKSDVKGLKAHQVHDLAKAKIEETEKLRRALGIRQDYQEGGHWKRQEERLREGVPERSKDRERRDEGDGERRRYRDED